jgi:putative ABC transport system substrate-binding protein
LQASRVTPIVIIASDYDPLALGFVASLERPGGNVTGLFFEQIDLTVKRLQLIKEAFPEQG